ncbi:MAG: GPP34 family phosphoprotein [Gammaproteobacteria bacterium]|nr:GPP34 family phosphoprotein [Gammaproteobacteria bacterium]
MALSIAEEVLLLTLHDSDGTFIKVPEYTMRYALSGAVLMDLALHNRIDTDLEAMKIVDATPTSDSILDGMLKFMSIESDEQTARYWIERTAVYADSIREAALERLVEHGILEQAEHRFLWVFKSRRYPIIDGKADKEVKLRIAEVLFTDTIPNPRDIALICLTHATGLLESIFTRSQLREVEDRIEQVRRLDLIGQTLANAIWTIEAYIASSSQPQFH